MHDRRPPTADGLARRAEALRRKLDYHSHRYYVIDSPVISDAQYDRLFRERSLRYLNRRMRDGPRFTSVSPTENAR